MTADFSGGTVSGTTGTFSVSGTITGNDFAGTAQYGSESAELKLFGQCDWWRDLRFHALNLGSIQDIFQMLVKVGQRHRGIELVIRLDL